MKLFKPIIKLLNKLKYFQKFLIIGLVLLLPFVIDSAILLGNNNEEVEKAEKQYEGLEYNLILKDILQNVQQTRALTVNATQGDNSVGNEIVSKHKTISSLVEDLVSYEKKAEYDFEMGETVNSIKANWTTLSSTNWSNVSDVVNEYSALTTEIIAAMITVSNNSELVLGNSKEIDNLVTSLSSTIPNLTEYLGKTRATGLSIINSGTLTDSQLDSFNNLVIPTEITFDQLTSELAISFNNSDIKSKLQSDSESFNKQIEEFIALNNSTILANDLSMDSDTYYNVATETIDSAFAMYDSGLALLTSLLDDSLEESTLLRSIVFTCVTVVLLLTIYLFTALYLSIRDSIKQLKEVSTEVANGNLDTVVSLQTKDEMNDIEISFNAMINSLRELVQQISQSSQHVAASSEQLSASAEETTAAIEHVSYSIETMASGAKTQTSGINDSTNSLHEMANGVQKIAENSQRVTELTREASTLAQDGNNTVSRTFDQMNTVQASVISTNQKIKELNERSQEIDSILSIITGIAAQTNLLALNAAIEAARAGEHGKGFAVVADEVRNLAEQSRESAAQIAELINTIQQDTVTSVSMMNQVNEDVKIDLQMTEETAQKFSLILNSMNTLTPEMEEVSATSEQISAGTQEIVATMNEMMSVSNGNLSLSEEVASSTEEQLASMQEISSSSTALSRMAEELQQQIQKFKL